MKNTVIVFTQKPLDRMIKEGGSGYWSANKNRVESCKYFIATRSKQFPSNDPKGSAFLIAKISGIFVRENKRLLIHFSEYAEINILGSWAGNRNPVAYTDIDLFCEKNELDISKLEWKKFPFDKAKIEDKVKALTIQEAKEGIAKTLNIDSSCIEIKITT